MLGFLLVIHVIFGILLIAMILMQSGRGGGLTETFSGVESIFGTKTNTFLVRGTTVLAVMFLITSLSLTYLSRQKGESLLQNEISSANEPKAMPLPPQDQPKPVAEPAKIKTITESSNQPIPQDIEKTGQETKQ